MFGQISRGILSATRKYLISNLAEIQRHKGPRLTILNRCGRVVGAYPPGIVPSVANDFLDENPDLAIIAELSLRWEWTLKNRDKQ